MFYKLDEDNNAVPCSTIEWSEMFDDFESRRVAWDEIDGIEISTVFLGLDHGHIFSKVPLLFKTMVFREDSSDDYQTRCSTWDGAIEMHKEAVKWVKGLRKNVD